MTNPQVMTRPRGMTSPIGMSSPRRMVGQRLYKRWIEELWAGHRIAPQLVTPDFVGHWPTHDVRGPAELQTAVDRTRTTLKELVFAVDVGPIVDGDMVAAHWIATGSGKNGPARFTGNDLLRISDGKIVEYWTSTARA